MYIYIYPSVCLSPMPITRKLKHILRWDFDEIKHSSSGKTKFFVTNRYVLSFALYSVEGISVEQNLLEFFL